MSSTVEAVRIQDLADRAELQDLLARQGLWLDERRFEAAAGIFTDDVTVTTLGGQAAGIEAVTAQARRVHTRYARTQHVTSNVLVDLDGDRATVRANLIAVFADDDEQPGPVARPVMVLGERYRFEAVRTARGWRFSRVEVVPMWKAGESPRT
jgi:hypothetical protein